MSLQLPYRHWPLGDRRSHPEPEATRRPRRSSQEMAAFSEVDGLRRDNSEQQQKGRSTGTLFSAVVRFKHVKFRNSGLCSD